VVPAARAEPGIYIIFYQKFHFAEMERGGSEGGRPGDIAISGSGVSPLSSGPQ
jgi:hypothetical protein